MQQGFDAEGARKAGYGDAEILSHLTSSRSFDVDGARNAGYSDAEIISHLSQRPARVQHGASGTWEEGPSTLDKIRRFPAEVTRGFGKGVTSTALGVSKMVGAVPETTTLSDIGMEPEGGAQQLGFAVEQIGEFFLPGGAVSKGVKAVEGARILANAPRVARGAATLGTRVGLEAGSMGAVTAAQTGGDREAVEGATKLAGAIPVAGRVVQPAANVIKRALGTRLPGRLIDSLIKPPRKERMFGRQPGGEVAREGLKANSLEGLEEEIAKRKEEIGKQINFHLGFKNARAQSIDIVPAILQPIDDAIRHAKTTTGNTAVVTRLEAVKDALLRERFGLDKLPTAIRLDPKTARKLKTEIGGAIKWTEDPVEGTVVDVMQGVYRNLNNLIDDAVPGVKKLNQRYSNLLSAEKSVQGRIDAVSRLNLVGLTELGAATTAGLMSAVLGGGATVAGVMGLLAGGSIRSTRHPATITRLASNLGKLSPQEKTVIAERLVPLLRNLGLAAAAQGVQE